MHVHGIYCFHLNGDFFEEGNCYLFTVLQVPLLITCVRARSSLCLEAISACYTCTLEAPPGLAMARPERRLSALLHTGR